jgi:hypothetical protein
MSRTSLLARLGGFAAGLLLIFGAAVAVGGISGIDRGARPAAAHADDAMGDMKAMAGGDAPRGLAIAQGGLRLVPQSTMFAAGRRAPFTFRIVDGRGRTVRDFAVEHTKRLHLIAVRRDLTGYQHLHPVQAADGSWSVPLRFAQSGVYRVYADFRAAGAKAMTTLATDVFVAGAFAPVALPAPATRASVDGYDIELTGGARAGREGDLAFRVTRGGRPVAVQPYLGAAGHLVVLRQGDLAYLHVHPHEAERPGAPITFTTQYPSAGRYRLMLQFRHAGRVHTAAFTQEVR